MVLDVVVVHLHKLKLVGVLQHGVTVVLAVRLVHKPHKPDTLTGGTTVLLHHTGLESAVLLEAVLEVGGGVVSHGVGKTARHSVNLAKSILGTHGCLHFGRRPDGLALLNLGAHEVIEHLLSTRGGSWDRQLTGVDTDDEGVVSLDLLNELVVLPGIVLNKVALGTSTDHTVGNRDGVVTVAVLVLVSVELGTTGGSETDVCKLVLGVLGLGKEDVGTNGRTAGSATNSTVSGHVHSGTIREFDDDLGVGWNLSGGGEAEHVTCGVQGSCGGNTGSTDTEAVLGTLAGICGSCGESTSSVRGTGCLTEGSAGKASCSTHDVYLYNFYLLSLCFTDEIRESNTASEV
mmetsp:Transcript_24447/g.29639  ORF Transcript_24447/g.29639 Transcript_24447/m.29639 type:complete len:346 (+) Transcript_24447:830-1867(+)